MDSCVEQVVAEHGYDKERAIAICYSSVVEGVELQEAIKQHNISALPMQDIAHESQEHTQARPLGLVFAARRDILSLELTPTDKTGHAWEVVVIGPKSPNDIATLDGTRYLRSSNSRYYSLSTLEAAAPLFEGAKVYDNHLTDKEFSDKQGMRSPAREWLGSLVNAHWDRATHSIRAVLKVVDDRFAQKLLRAHEGGVLQTIGLSIDAMIDGITKRVGETMAQLVHRITRVNSVDAVGEPAAGGQFVRLLESIIATPHPSATAQDGAHVQEEGNMEEVMRQIEQLLAAIDASMLPDDAKAALKAELEKVKASLGAPEEAPAEESAGGKGPMPDDTAGQEARLQEAKASLRAIEAIVKVAIKKDKPAPAAEPSDAEKRAQAILKQAEDAAKRILEAAKIAQGKTELEAALSASGLPGAVATIVREQYEGRAFDPKDMKATIEKHRDAYLRALESAGNRVIGHGRTHASIGVGSMTVEDRFQIGLLRLMRGPNWHKDVDPDRVDKRGRRVFEAHDAQGNLDSVKNWIKDGRESQRYFNDLRDWSYAAGVAELLGLGGRAAEAALTTSALSSVTKNTVNLLLAADYSVREGWWNDIVDEIDVDTIDDVTLVRLFGISALPVINEGAAYTELDTEDEEETAVYRKRGGYIGVTLETMLKGKIDFLQALPTRLSNAWYNTVSDRVANVFTINSAVGATLADTGALFNSTAVTTAGGHANLLTTAFSHAALDAVYTAMMKQTDQPLGVGRRLGMENKPTHILGPVDLRNAILSERNSEFVPGQSGGAATGGEFQTMNQYQGDFEVVVVPPWTDVNNWAAVAKPGGKSAIKLVYLQGRRTPELFDARDEAQGAMFTNDEMRYKVRQFLFQQSAADDSAPVADWRSLHKNNVA